MRPGIVEGARTSCQRRLDTNKLSCDRKIQKICNYYLPECKQMNSADFAATYVTGSSLSDFQNVHR